MTELLKWLRENNVAGFFILLLFIAAIFATIYIMKAIARFKKIEGACKNIPDMDNRINIGVGLSESIERKIDSQSEKFGVLATNITTLIAFLTTKHTDLQSGLFQSFSPIQLTDLGKELLNKSGGQEYIDQNSQNLISLMEKQNFKSALDVQNYANSLLINLFNTDEFVDIRNYIYQNPLFTSGKNSVQVNWPNINQVMGIYLRDKYFEKHPELRDAEDTHLKP
jgi:hypothetical protein